MKDPAFREERWSARYTSPVESINRLADRLSGGVRGRVPYVDPAYGGVEAQILVLMLYPGPGTASGFLSPDNDDPSAELFASSLEAADLSVNQVLSWNMYPWGAGSNKPPTPAQLDLGVEPLHQLLTLLRRLEVVLLMGTAVQDGWKRFKAKYPAIARQYTVIPTFDTSGRGITGGGQHSKEYGINAVVDALKRARDVVSATHDRTGVEI